MKIDTKILNKEILGDAGYGCTCDNPRVDAGYENITLIFNSFIELWDGEVVSDTILLNVCPTKDCHVWRTSLIMPYAIDGKIELNYSGQDDVGFSYEHGSYVTAGVEI